MENHRVEIHVSEIWVWRFCVNTSDVDILNRNPVQDFSVLKIDILHVEQAVVCVWST